MRLPPPSRIYRAHIPTLQEVPRALQSQKQLAMANLNNIQTRFDDLPGYLGDEIRSRIDQIYVGLDVSDYDFERIFTIRCMIYNEYSRKSTEMERFNSLVDRVMITIKCLYVSLLAVIIVSLAIFKTKKQSSFNFTTASTILKDLPENKITLITVEIVDTNDVIRIEDFFSITCDTFI